MTVEDEHLRAEFDREALAGEIAREVELRRTRGELPPALEQELDQAFTALAPGSVDEAASVVGEVERAAHLQLQPPFDHLSFPRRQVKQVLFKLMAWYVQYVVEQFATFGRAVVRSLRQQEEQRVVLERGLNPLPDSLRRVLEQGNDFSPPPELVGHVVAKLVNVPGRILVAESGDGALLRALCDSGVDAYGTEPRRGHLRVSLRRGLEVRPSSGVEHLCSLGPQRLAAVVLVGAPVEWEQVTHRIELLAKAVRAVTPGGLVLVVSRTLEWWLENDGATIADLAPGSPFRPPTWSRLLEDAGLTIEDVGIDADGGSPTPAGYVVTARLPSDRHESLVVDPAP